ncbi:uncharacterized protein PHACADRAFT_144885 [Phanerochaete carnosa HHB-10118-sp]|uniref:JmjC domain-containing protein n=1 Tax=Phanerochaete carnosa (strain HHB-10118-sp) TaxID=650164 RepID=K5WAE5_PHACS|nr:uncharacterized protein PHACADRAFT_144885 [Phanerochaete carnosa HHB-10118-sp]EKM55939.1 hypothetical protein PHACADRAFT_144885 [Phanerochaete carnosa HHB-10118-sp]
MHCGETHTQTLRIDLGTEEAPTSLDGLISIAHEKLSHAYRLSQPTLCWRRLYTDACILRSLACILGRQTEAFAAESVARLDQAIIVAGPAGEGRLELIHEFISRLQVMLPPTTRISRLLTSNATPSPPPPNTFSDPILRLDTSPSLASFLNKCSRAPFVLSGFIRDWPALSEHPWHSLDYLHSVAGPARIVPVEVGHDYRSDDWTQKLMPWEDFLDALVPARDGTRPALYLAQHNLFNQFPALRDDIVIPDYAYAAPRPPADYPDYRPPPNEDQLVINVWLGPAGTVSPAHTDPFFNLYAQVVGRKTVWLAPPEAAPHMRAYAPAPDAPSTQPHNPAANTTEPLLSNTSSLDVFVPDADALPVAFKEHVVPRAMCATLEPGDLLFFPPGWWHAMRSEETSFSVSMWF